MLKRSELYEGFQGNVYKDEVRKGICGVWDQVMDVSSDGLMVSQLEVSISNLFTFLYCSWGYQGKNEIAVCSSRSIVRTRCGAMGRFKIGKGTHQ